MFNNEFFVRADERSIVLRHPFITDTIFTFYIEGHYRYYRPLTDVNIQPSHEWKLDHEIQQLMFKNFKDEWSMFWVSDVENNKKFYNAILEWLDIDRILLGSTDPETNIQ